MASGSVPVTTISFLLFTIFSSSSKLFQSISIYKSEKLFIHYVDVLQSLKVNGYL